ncbi:hypothetical protein KAR91_65215 [Candidatus Pacearchaeota archaeon]|nr:hypothetical protein [Candidatus Pacearchaeota archaeon]
MEIPKMIHPLSKHWEQPSRSTSLVDETHAVMDESTLKALHDYSCSQPSGVYDGKMWRSKIRDKWFLRWFGPSKNPEMCSTNTREILLT